MYGYLLRGVFAHLCGREVLRRKRGASFLEDHDFQQPLHKTDKTPYPVKKVCVTLGTCVILAIMLEGFGKPGIASNGGPKVNLNAPSNVGPEAAPLRDTCLKVFGKQSSREEGEGGGEMENWRRATFFETF